LRDSKRDEKLKFVDTVAILYYIIIFDIVIAYYYYDITVLYIGIILYIQTYSACFAAQHHRDVVNILRGLRLLVTARRMKKRITINAPQESSPRRWWWWRQWTNEVLADSRSRIDAIHGGNLPVLNVYSNTRKCDGVGFFLRPDILIILWNSRFRRR